MEDPKIHKIEIQVPKIQLCLNEKPEFVALVEMAEGILAIPLENTVHFYYDFVPDGNRTIIPMRCNNCKNISLNTDASLEFTDIDSERQMGEMVFYAIESGESECQYCGSKFYFKFDLSTYAYSWGIDEHEVEGCELLAIGDLEEVIGHYYNDAVRARIDSMVDPEIILEQNKDDIRYVIVVEGDDDISIWTGLLQKSGVDPKNNGVIIMKGARGGGVYEAIPALLIARKLVRCKRKLLLDSDNDREKLERELTKHNILKSEYHILNAKEIESYLLNASAISTVTGTPLDVVDQTIFHLPRKGKEGLEILFERLNLPKPSAQVKLYLAKHLDKVPAEIQEIINEVKTSIM